uniref:Polycystin cation channel PKD1/PKD2 domain-containing protein n=1 Tax=Hemiselmis andersenii TaxID=464988 RepID=A0A6U4MUT9_HEMAN|mmetsp:Transcript_9488/g.22195  ORF Transcript_9488/g.22195 Transcript_9488/m.22195 type:complete len:854 (-) Transcript_9488:361-2922(-)
MAENLASMPPPNGGGFGVDEVAPTGRPDMDGQGSGGSGQQLGHPSEALNSMDLLEEKAALGTNGGANGGANGNHGTNGHAGDDPHAARARKALEAKEADKNETGSSKGLRGFTFKAMLGVDEENERVDVKASLDNIERWPAKKKGYSQLCSFLLFFALYCCVMVMQINPGEVFRIDDALRNQVVDEQGALQDVSTLGDLFDYLTEQIMENVFPGAWYNDDPLTTSEAGYVLDYNKLVGGLLIVQRRGVRRKCVEPRYKLTNSSYDEFYRVCYTEKTTEGLITKNETAAAALPPDSLDFNVPWLPGGLPPEGLKMDPDDIGSVFGVNPTMTPPARVLEKKEATGNKLGNFEEAFVYDHRYGGFSSFLAYADGSIKNLAKIEALKETLWLDKFTRGVDIKFAVYNGHANMFTFVAISFNYALTGAFKEYQRDAGTQVVIKTVNMEPYRIGGENPPSDLIRLILEIILLIWIYNYIASLIRELVECGLKEGWSGKRKKDRATGQIVQVGGVANMLKNPWTLIDTVNYILFILYITTRLDILTTIYDTDKIIAVPTNKYESVLEEISSKLSTQLLLNFFNILLCLVRCFKFYRFQPRLAIINRTLINAFPDLYHFCLMFITVLFGFAVMSNILFGTELWQFSTLLEALNTGWLWMNGALNYAEIARVDAEMSVVYYVSFVFLINIVLLNVLLAILVDSYAVASDQTKDEFGGEADNVPSLGSDIGEIFKRTFSWGGVSDHILQNVLTMLEEAEKEFVTKKELLSYVPPSIIASQKLTEDKMCSNPSIVLIEVDADEEKLKASDDAMEAAMAAHASLGDAGLSRQDKMEASLLGQIDELVRENAFLKRQYAAKRKKEN